MLPAMKEGERSLNNYITATNAFSGLPIDLRSFFGEKKLEETLDRKTIYLWPTISDYSK